MINIFIGMGLCLIVLPLIDGLMSIIASLFELVCTKIAVKVYFVKKQIEDEEAKKNVHEPCIGFTYNLDESEEDEDEEEDKIVMGFRGGKD